MELPSCKAILHEIQEHSNAYTVLIDDHYKLNAHEGKEFFDSILRCMETYPVPKEETLNALVKDYLKKRSDHLADELKQKSDKEKLNDYILELQTQNLRLSNKDLEQKPKNRKFDLVWGAAIALGAVFLGWVLAIISKDSPLAKQPVEIHITVPANPRDTSIISKDTLEIH